MNLQTYLALKAVVEADFEKLIFYQTVSDIDPPKEDEPEPPHSYSGSFVQFASKKQINAEDVVVDIEPVQAGSGDPSPDNVRHAGCDGGRADGG